MNLQQIPRANLEIKPMFKTPSASEKIEEIEDELKLNPYDSIETTNGWIKAKQLKVGDEILEEETQNLLIIEKISMKDTSFIIKFREKQIA